jgi:hypothetical protein
MDPFTTWISAIAASISAVGAVAAWFAARASNSAARAIAEIEQARHHAELSPVLLASIQAGQGNTLRLTIHLDGPLDLESLDALTVRIRNDTTNRTPLPGSAVTTKQLNDHIWGPARFTPAVDGASADGREVGPVPLAVGDSVFFQLEDSVTQPWPGFSDAIAWRRQYLSGGIPVRISVFCEKVRMGGWTIPLEVDLPRSLYENPDAAI